MCGITGLYHQKGSLDPNTLHSHVSNMTARLHHRGPDDGNIWQDPESPIALGHRRLSIQDLSAQGAQPMASPSGRYVMVYNGEIYNFQALRHELEETGFTSFRGHSDTEIMLACIDQWGLNRTLQKINGMFAIGLWDRQEKILHLVRDRFGKKPLYVGWAGQDLCFASELKAFHANPDFQPVISTAGLSTYMHYGYVCAPYSIFKNVWQILPGARLVLKVDQLGPLSNLAPLMTYFWSPVQAALSGKANPLEYSEQEAVCAFSDQFDICVKQRMESDVPLGAFLSGGIDSSAVVASMQRHATQPVKTFSIGFENPNYNEAEYAKSIADHLGTDHHELYVGAQDCMDVIPSLADIYDEPFSDISQIPTYLISKMAQKDVSVILSGDGGDEILGGYQRYTHVAPVWSALKWLPHIFRHSLEHAIKAVPSSLYRRVLPNHPQLDYRVRRMADIMGSRDQADLYNRLLSRFYNPSDFICEYQDCDLPVSDLRSLQGQCSGGQLNTAEFMMIGDCVSYRPDNLMVKTDRAGMANSLEIRAPLMDYQLFEFCARLPHTMKIKGRTGKWLLREVLRKDLPDALFDRPKMGFTLPIHTWLNGPLAGWASDLLNPIKIQEQGLLNASAVDSLWQNFTTGQGNTQQQGVQLWTLLMFQSWYQKWMMK